MSPMPSGPWVNLSMDFYSLPTGEEVFVVIEDYSRFPEVHHVNSTSSHDSTVHRSAVRPASMMVKQNKKLQAMPTAVAAGKPSSLQVGDTVLLRNDKKLNNKMAPAFFPDLVTIAKKNDSMITAS